MRELINNKKIVDKLTEGCKRYNKYFKVVWEDGDLYLKYGNFIIACFISGNLKAFWLNYASNDTARIIVDNCEVLPYFYNEYKKYLDNIKYYIQVLNNNTGYLNYVIDDKTYVLSKTWNTKYLKSEFTLSEIEKLQQNEDLHIDWNTVVFKEVE